MLLSLIGTISIPKRGGIGTYWFSNANDDWYNLQNWYISSSLTTKATLLPNNTTEVTVVSSTQFPYINLNNPNWVQPFSINANTTELTFYSNPAGPPVSVTCSLIAKTIRWEGNSRFNTPS